MVHDSESRELTAAEVDVVEGGMAEKLKQETENKNERPSGKGFGPADFLKW